MTYSKILRAALELPESERVELVDRLLETIPHVDDDDERLAELEESDAEGEPTTALVKDAERAAER